MTWDDMDSETWQIAPNLNKESMLLFTAIGEGGPNVILCISARRRPYLINIPV